MTEKYVTVILNQPTKLVASMVGLARNHQDREAQAIGWFVVVLFVLSPTEASYHFILLLVAVTLLLPGMSRRWAAGLLILYVLAELPLFPWDARFFPKAWLVLSLFFYGGWHFLRQIGCVRLGAAVLAAAAVGSADATLRLPAYWREPPGARPGGEPGILPGWKSDRVCLGSAWPALHRGDLDIRWRNTKPGEGPRLLRAGRLAGWAPAGICLFGDRRASGLGARSEVRS